MKKLKNPPSLNEYFGELRDVKGIFDGRKAFIGPELVQVDLTNVCDNQCLGCWLHGKELKDKKFRKEAIDIKVLKRLLHELKRLGVKRINLSGGGEPYCYPDIDDAIELIKKLGFHLNINTSFSMMTKDRVEALVYNKVDYITLSVWSTDAQSYVKQHPNKTEKDFNSLKENLIHLLKIKHEKPKINFYNVINRYNFTEIKDMVRFAESFKAEGVGFNLVDVKKGKTDHLKLGPDEKKIVLDSIIRAQKENRIRKGPKINIFGAEEFMEKNIDAERMVNSIPCYMGWIFCRIFPNGNVGVCCKSYKFVMGNINDKEFRKIWFSKRYDEFRRKALKMNKEDIYFKNLGCVKSCDNFTQNKETVERLQRLNIFDKIKLLFV